MVGSVEARVAATLAVAFAEKNFQLPGDFPFAWRREFGGR